VAFFEDKIGENKLTKKDENGVHHEKDPFKMLNSRGDEKCDKRNDNRADK